MSQHTETERLIALAGIFQATTLVRDIAVTGQYDEADFEACIHSLFRIDAETAEDVYGQMIRLRTGFRAIAEQLGGQQYVPGNETRDINIAKYAINIMVLERRLAKEPEMLKTIADGISRAEIQAGHFTKTHENVIANLAHLYSQTISTIKPRVMINGQHNYISNPTHANQIRALLLAAIRAAVLWRQCGGNRWQLFFKRNAIVKEAARLAGLG
jgi:high frequency lysogenization protein